MSKSFTKMNTSCYLYYPLSLPPSLPPLYSDRLLSILVSYYPSVEQCLSEAGTCSVCGEPYVNSWLDCVQFKKPKQVK